MLRQEQHALHNQSKTNSCETHSDMQQLYIQLFLNGKKPCLGQINALQPDWNYESDKDTLDGHKQGSSVLD